MKLTTSIWLAALITASTVSTAKAMTDEQWNLYKEHEAEHNRLGKLANAANDNRDWAAECHYDGLILKNVRQIQWVLDIDHNDAKYAKQMVREVTARQTRNVKRCAERNFATAGVTADPNPRSSADIPRTKQQTQLSQEMCDEISGQGGSAFGMNVNPMLMGAMIGCEPSSKSQQPYNERQKLAMQCRNLGYKGNPVVYGRKYYCQGTDGTRSREFEF